ncbi:hypothetical protein IGI49_003424 [Enterococcus sp. AZ071]
MLTPKGELLRAFTFTDSTLAEIAIDSHIIEGPYETDERTIQMDLTAKKETILEIPYDENLYKIEFPNLNISQWSYTEQFENEMLKQELISGNIESTTELLENEKKSFPSLIKAVNPERENSGNFYLSVSEGDTIKLSIVRFSNEAKEIIVHDIEDTSQTQILVSYLDGEMQSSEDINESSENTSNSFVDTDQLEDNEIISKEPSRQPIKSDSELEDFQMKMGNLQPLATTTDYTEYIGANLSEYDLNDKNSWMTPEFDNVLDFSEVTFQGFGRPGTVLNTPARKGVQFKDFAPDSINNDEFGVFFENVKYNNKDFIDIKMKFDYVQTNPLHHTSVGTLSSINCELRFYNDQPFFIANLSRGVSAARYVIEFYKHNTNIPYSVKLPLIYGDVDGPEQYWVENGTNIAMYPTIFKQKSSDELIIGKKNSEETIVFEPKQKTDISIFEPAERVPSMTFKGSATSAGWMQRPNIPIVNPGDNVLNWSQAIGFHSTVPTQVVKPKKYVSDSDENLVFNNELSDLHEIFTYSLEGKIPQNAYQKYNLSEWVLEDEMPDGLSLVNSVGNIKAYATSNNNQDVTNYFMYDLDETTRKLTIKAKGETLSNPSFYSLLRNLRFDVPVKITELSKINKNSQGKLEIKNKVNLSATYFNGQKDSIDSNEVVTTVKIPKQLTINKSVDKELIETGNQIDPAQPENTSLTTFSYTLTGKNTSFSSIENIRILDVLPFNSDARNSDFSGSYMIKNVSSSMQKSDIYYSVNSVSEFSDPNDLVITQSTGWYKMSEDSSQLANAKALVILAPKIAKNEQIEIKITMQPEQQKAGECFINDASLNSELNDYQKTKEVKTFVVGRDLSGVAWYDDSLDGLIGNKPDQSVLEDFAKDIPVKLYRTSLENPDYKNQLVKESLTGEEFIDSSGNSKIKTNENGEYIFKNLPEGEYVAEFIIDGEIHRVTKQLIGDDVTKNSKADPNDNKTPNYTQPKLNELASVWGQADSINHVTDVNVGLIRPGTIKLFKYEAGTAIDGNKDGELSDPEKATGTPLKGAVFDLYQGHTGTGTKLGTATTDEDGKLQFDVGSGLTENLFPGEYSLVETKAPSGFELLKKPIKVTITQGNQVIQLYQDNDVQTDLPFTGGDNPMIMLLLAAASLMTVGFIGMMLYYRQPKRRRHTR